MTMILPFFKAQGFFQSESFYSKFEINIVCTFVTFHWCAYVNSTIFCTFIIDHHSMKMMLMILPCDYIKLPFKIILQWRTHKKPSDIAKEFFEMLEVFIPHPFWCLINPKKLYLYMPSWETLFKKYYDVGL